MCRFFCIRHWYRGMAHLKVWYGGIRALEEAKVDVMIVGRGGGALLKICGHLTRKM